MKLLLQRSCAVFLVAAHLTSTEAFTTRSSIALTNNLVQDQQCNTNNGRALYLASSINDDDNSLNNDNSEQDARDAGPPKEYLATCIPGLAPYLEDELLSCGIVSTQVLSNAAVSFTTPSNDDGSIPLKALIWVRTAHRILEKIETFYDIESRDDVYNAVQSSPLHVKDLLGDGDGGLLSLSVKVIANGARLPKDISHSHYTALTIKNALVDQVRELKDGERPNVDLDDPDVPLVAILHSPSGMAAEMTLYRSLAPPGSLHRRGYRAGGAIHKAAMKESMAAGLLLASGWKEACDGLRTSTDETNDEGLTLIDPMCGSGSLLVEAAMMAVDFAPGLMRIMNGVPGHQVPPVLRWKGNKETLIPIWKEMMLDASQRVKTGLSWVRENDGKMEILGNDIHGGALDLVESSLANARGLDRIVDLHQNDCCKWNIAKKEERENQQVWVMTNPPWGVRLSDDDHESWESLRIFLRENCPAGRTQAWVLSGNKSATKHLGLRRSQSIPLKTGQQDLRWIQYVMQERIPWQENAIQNNDEAKDEVKADNAKLLDTEQQQPRQTTRTPEPAQRTVKPTPPTSKRESDQVRAETTEERSVQPSNPSMQNRDNEKQQQVRERDPEPESAQPSLQRSNQQRQVNTPIAVPEPEQRIVQPTPPASLGRDDKKRPARSSEQKRAEPASVSPTLKRDDLRESEKRPTRSSEQKRVEPAFVSPTLKRNDQRNNERRPARNSDRNSGQKRASPTSVAPAQKRDNHERVISTPAEQKAPMEQEDVQSSTPTLQRDDQNRFIRNPVGNTATLQTDDQQRLIRVRPTTGTSSPRKSRAPVDNDWN